jgi:hypothetical protein
MAGADVPRGEGSESRVKRGRSEEDDEDERERRTDDDDLKRFRGGDEE